MNGYPCNTEPLSEQNPGSPCPSSLNLRLGSYDFKVHKEGKPGLYSKAVVQIFVEKVGLVANIKGGSMRVVGYQNKNNVTLDGSSSFDPDFPEEKDQLRYDILVPL